MIGMGTTLLKSNPSQPETKLLPTIDLLHKCPLSSLPIIHPLQHSCWLRQFAMFLEEWSSVGTSPHPWNELAKQDQRGSSDATPEDAIAAFSPKASHSYGDPLGESNSIKFIYVALCDLQSSKICTSKFYSLISLL